jgi:hypothetical protein
LRAGALVFCIAAVEANCWAAPINNPGVPAACLGAGSRNMVAKPGQPGYAVSGPVDTDPLSPIDTTDAAIDMCITFYFSVPETLTKTSGGLNGWGALVLTFSAPIDGGSFIFDPNCPTATQGTLNTANVISGVDGSTIPAKTMIQFLPSTTSSGGAGYQLPPTGAVNSDGVEFQQFAVTIVYDTNSKDDGSGNVLPVPTVVIGQSFWQAKPIKGTPFTYVDPATVQRNGDLLLPEPSFWPVLLVSTLFLFSIRRRQIGLSP